jgi:hypothetical protein
MQQRSVCPEPQTLPLGQGPTQMPASHLSGGVQQENVKPVSSLHSISLALQRGSHFWVALLHL